MEIFAGASVLLLVVAAFIVVVKTFALWWRTRARPELLLSLYLTCATVLGYPLAVAMGIIPATRSWEIHVVAESVMSVGWISLVLFTQHVFRPHTGWARWLVAFTLCTVAVSVTAYAIEVTGPNPRRPEEMAGLYLVISLPVAIGYFWTTIESLAYYGQLRRRLRLGLADVVVANRVLLWGLMTLAAGSALAMNMAALLAGSYMSPPVILVSSVLGLAHAGCLFLAFHPPRWYRGWVEGSDSVEAA
jgi:hypothetical protein